MSHPLPADKSCSHEHCPLSGQLTELLDGAHYPGHDHHPHLVNIHRLPQRRALFICILLTAIMMVVEFIAGLLTGSLMLISDAIHMLSHAASLGVSFMAISLAQKRTGEKLSFGLYRVEILAALFNGIGLAGFSLWIVYKGITRLLDPVAVLGPELTAVALIGLAVNLTTAFILQRAGLEDLNTKSAFLHMLADTLSSVAIVIGGIIISFTNWMIVDPLLSMVVAGVVAKWSWGLLRDSTLILLEHRPKHFEDHEIVDKLKQEFKEIRDIHDIHIWEITSQFISMTVHIVLDDVMLSETCHIRSRIADYLRHKFAIAHVVIQLEC